MVLWTVLERKARAIERFLGGTADVVEEEGADADAFAEFMSQSTGNPVFRLNMQTEKALTAESARTAGIIRSRDGAIEFLKAYPNRRRQIQQAIEQLDGLKAGDLTATVKFKEVRGRRAEYEAVMGDARAAYQAEYDAWLDKDAAYEKALAEWEAANPTEAPAAPADAATPKKKPAPKTRKPKPPEAPVRPTILSPAVLEQSDYARTVKGVLEAMRDGYADQRFRIKIGDKLLLSFTRTSREVKVAGKPTTMPRFSSVLETTSGLVLDRDWNEAMDPANSSAILALFEPRLIDAAIARNLSNERSLLETLDRRKEGAEVAKEGKVDTTRRDELRELSDFYSVAVELAELEERRARAGRPNRFVAADKRRPLGDASAARVDALRKVDFTFEGEVYEGTGLSSGRENVADFEAYRASDGRLAYVRAERQEKTAPWAATSVRLLPAAAEADMPGGFAGATIEGQATPAPRARKAAAAAPVDLRNLTAALNAELAKSGVGGRVKLALTSALFFEGAEAYGLFQSDPDQRRGLITVSTKPEGNPLGTLRHEIIHALRSTELWGGDNGLFSATEWKALVRNARADRAMIAKARADYPELTDAEQIEEVIAEQYLAWAQARDSASPVAAIFQRIRDVAAAIVSVLNGQGYATAGTTFRAIAEGRIGARADAAAPRILFQSGPARAAQAARAEAAPTPIDMGAMGLDQIKPRARKITSGRRTDDGRILVTDADEKTLVEQAITQAMGSGKVSSLGLVPGRALFKELGRNLPSAATYLRLKERLDAMRDEWHARADTIAQGWRREASKNMAANGRLMDLMHDSTLQGQDPTKPFVRRATRTHLQAIRTLPPTNRMAMAAQAIIDKDQERKSQYDDLVSAYNALPKEMRDLYSKVRDEYTALSDGFEKAILDNIKKAMNANIRKAERTHADEMRRIDDDGLVGGERDDAIRAADAALDAARARLGFGARARLEQLRRQFESNKVDGPYFPLSRFGEFFATVRDDDGVVTNFSRFESIKERDRFAALERAKSDQSVTVGVMREVQLRTMVDPNFVAEVENILGDTNMPKEVMDQVWQKWLTTLPELSVRLNRIHRKGRAGFDRDAFRAFGRHMFHGSHQLARLAHTIDMADALEEAAREAARRPDATRSGLIVKEMERRHEYTMNPAGAWWAQILTQAAFVWYLAATPAAAAVNITQTTIVGIPVLATLNPGKGGMGQASRQLGRALLDFTRGKGEAMESNRLTPDEKAAMKEAYDKGIIERTQSHDLGGVAESGIEYNARVTRVMAAISYFFHHTERMNREVTFLAAYRMAKANGAQTSADAIDKASDLTWRAHFDYTNTSRPRLMQGDTARVLLTFRNFQINMLWRLVRDTHQAVYGQDAATRREARKQLIGMTAMMALHAGVTGTWMFGLSMSIIGLFFPDGDDPEEELKRAVIETLGADLGGAVLYGLPGHMTGIDLTNRIGMPDLWFRSPDRPVEGEDAYNYWLKQLVGAVPSIAEGMFRGAKDIADGNTMRGVEQMMPKVARDILRTYRYASEGVVTRKGDPLVDDVPTMALIVQALGFTPAVIAERYAVNSRLYTRQEEILTERREVLREAATSVIERKPLSREILAKINTFNAANPDYPIMARTITLSVKARLKARENAEFGATLNEKLNDRLRAERAPLVYGD